MKDWQNYLLAFGIVAVILAGAFVVNPGASFGGADMAGAKAISEANPGYKPWVQPLWAPPPETESMLFALQAAIGAIIIGYFIGYEKARKEFAKAKESE